MKEKFKKHWKIGLLVVVLTGSVGWNAWIMTASYLYQLQQAAAQNAANAVLTQITEGVEKTGQFVITKQGKDGKAESTLTLKAAK